MRKKYGLDAFQLFIFLALGIASRLVADALHLPGFYQASGAIGAAYNLGLPWGALVGVLTIAALDALMYSYSATSLMGFMIGVWVPGATAAVYEYSRRRVPPPLSVLLAALVYVLSWFITYALVFTRFKLESSV